MTNDIFTIGYEGVTIEQAVATLKTAGVTLLLDIRAVPLSRRPGFSKNKLAGHLAQAGIGYLLLKTLGTPAEGRAAARKGNVGELRRIYEMHLDTLEAQAGFAAALAEIPGAGLLPALLRARPARLPSPDRRRTAGGGNRPVDYPSRPAGSRWLDFRP